MGEGVVYDADGTCSVVTSKLRDASPDSDDTALRRSAVDRRHAVVLGRRPTTGCDDEHRHRQAMRQWADLGRCVVAISRRGPPAVPARFGSKAVVGGRQLGQIEVCRPRATSLAGRPCSVFVVLIALVLSAIKRLLGAPTDVWQSRRQITEWFCAHASVSSLLGRCQYDAHEDDDDDEETELITKDSRVYPTTV